MRYENVCLESLGYVLPEEVVTSAEIESRLEPLYSRLRLPAGRLELMTGIRERRFWAPGTMPGTVSVQSAEIALANTGLAKRQIGALIHASVCRDHLEPATACGVHHRLGLPRNCVIYDVSNACLGVLNGMLQIANMIELGQIEAGIVVATESARPLVETTIDQLNRDTSLTREQMKLAVASLTIGSASVAAVLTHRSLSRTGNRIFAATARANTDMHQLCQSHTDQAAAGGKQPLMQTDSEKLLHEGVALGKETFDLFLAETGWSREQIDRTFCHQVGVAHRKLNLQSLRLNPANDFTTVEFLGNTGSAALPITLALGMEQGLLKPDDQVALLGIGSGINALLMAVDWQQATVTSAIPAPHGEFASTSVHRLAT